MPPLGSASKGKGKTRDARRSRSRNTTPSSVLSAGTTTAGPTTTPLLELETSKLLVSSKPNYSEIIDHLETHGTRLEPKSLHDIIDQLKHLSESAEKRAESCEKAIRLIHEQKKELESDQQHREREAELARRTKARNEETHSQKNPKSKKRKDRPETFDSVEIKREGTWATPIRLESLIPLLSAVLPFHHCLCLGSLQCVAVPSLTCIDCAFVFAHLLTLK